MRVFVCADRPPELVIQGRSTSGCRHMRQSGVYTSKCASSLPAPGQLRCSGAGVVSSLAPDPRVRVAAARPHRVSPWRRPCFLIFQYTLYSKQEAASQKVAPDARTASLKISQPAPALAYHLALVTPACPRPPDPRHLPLVGTAVRMPKERAWRLVDEQHWPGSLSGA